MNIRQKIRLLVREAIGQEIEKRKPTTDDMLKDIVTSWHYDGFYASFNDSELMNIVKFIDLVNERTDSGTGVGASKSSVRDAFMACPQKFKTAFQEIPNARFWRGDQGTPCEDMEDPRFDIEYHEYDMSMQSFTNRNHAKFFGHFVFPASTIKSYSGCFSLPKFNKSLSFKDTVFISSIKFFMDNPEYQQHFDFKEFYPFFYVMKGDGIIGRKYQNKFLKMIKLDYGLKRPASYEMEYLYVGDDEGEVMFFDVKYDCKKMEKLSREEHWG